MNCRRGDVVLVLFPDSNLRSSKRRPALIVQADQLGADLQQTIVAMITSNMTRAGHPSRDNLATIHHSEIDRIIGTFGGLKEIDVALRTTLAL